MPKLSRRKQSKPQHLSSDDEETTASPSESAKDVIADDNGNIITTRSKARSNKLGNSKLNSPIKSDHCSPKTKNVIEHDRVTGIKDDIREDIQEEKSVNIDSLEENSIDKETVKVIDRVTYSSKTNGKVNKVIFNGISCESEVESSGSGVKVKLRNIHDQGEKMVVSENTEHVAEEQKVIINNYREENNDADDNQYDEISDGASIDPDSDDELKNDGDSLTDACRYDFVDGDTKDSFNSDENSGILDSEADRDLYNTQEENKNADFLGVERNSSGDLQRHMTKHTGERPFICLLCNRGFKAKRSLQYHQFSVHGVEHKNISERYPDIRKRKLEAGELVDDSIITELEQKRMKLDDSMEGEGDTPAVSPVLNGVGEQVKKRVCEICNKVCVKPSDLKRHMMIHTGERPFKCEACGKPFRAKNSMMYHLKSSHGYNIELSPGLEERFMRLKKQTRLGSVMAGLHGEDPMDLGMSGQDDNEKASSNNPALANTKGSIISLSNKKLPLELDPRFHNLPSHMQKKFYSCDLNSFTEGEAELDESSGLFKLKDIGIEFPDPDVLTPTQQDLPSHVVKPGGNLVGKDIVLESKGKRQDLTVKNETVLVTRLDSVLMNGKEVCLYKCYLCGKIFNYFSKVQRHLSLHFEREITTYNCALCDASFWFRHQIYQHIRKKHSKELRQEKSTENNDSTRDEIDSTSNTTLQSDFSNNQETNTLNSSMGHLPEAQSKGSLEGQVLQQYIRALRFRRDTSGTFVCMICRQGFQQEQSILKHIKIHSNHKFSYCNQCGDGFTDYSLLQEHLEHCSDSRNVHSTKLQYPAILNSNMASSSKYGVPDKSLVMMSNSTALYNTPFQKEQLNSFQINREGINLTPVHAESRNSSPPIVIPETVTNAPNSASISDDAKSSLLSHLLKKTTECAGIRSNTSVFGKVQQNCEDLTHPEEEKSKVGENKNSQEEMARALLEQEGIKEDVTVVMPCDPEDIPVNEQTETSEKEDDWSENADTEESQMSEILAAPKRTLMSNLSSKSRRKTSQPMRINHDTEIAANSLLQLNEEPLILPKDVKQELKSPEVNNHEEEIKTTSPSVAVVNPTLNSSLMKSCSPVPTTSTQESVMSSSIPQQNPNLNLLSASEQLAQAIAASGQGKNMTPAFANLSAQALVNAEKLPPVMQALIGAGHFPPSLSQTLSLPAAQPLLQGQIHDSLTQSLNSSAAQVLLAASHLSSPLTQALALQAIHAHINRDSNSAGSSSQESKNSESNSIEKPTSASLTASQQAALLMGGGAATNLALFPGFSAGNIAMNPLTGLPLSVQVSTPDSSSKDREASSASPHSTTNSEKSSTEPSPVDSRDHLVGYPRVQWSPSESGLSNFTWSQISTDGRKVTSLSRTHSRLPIINTPVNREQICKPTTLEDGRQVFRCPFCSKDFLSYSDINRHMDFHEDIRPYKCKYCEYYARTNSQLKVHMMRHQGIREFCCKVCNYKGVTQSDLNRHMKSQIHMLKSRNECSYCGEGFVTTKNLEKHLDGNCIVKVQQEKGEEYLC